MRFFGWGKKRVEKHKDLAWNYFRARDFRRAREEFARWTEIEPDSATAWFGYGDSSLMSLLPLAEVGQDINEALDLFVSVLEKATQLNKSTGELTPNQLAYALLYQGWRYKFKGEAELAIPYYREAIKAAPNSEFSVQARLELIARAEEKEDLDAVEQLLREILEINPEDEKTKEHLNNLERRRTGIEILFSMWMPPPGLNTAVWVHVDETLGEIAARVLPKYGFSYEGGVFMYTGDNAGPSYIDSGYHEYHRTVRELGMKARDKLVYLQLIETPGTEGFDLFGIKQARKYLGEGRQDLAQKEIENAIKSVEWVLKEGELDKAEAKVKAILQLDPENSDAQSLHSEILAEIRKRDTSSASADGAYWSHSHGGPARTSQTSRGPAPPLHPIWEFNNEGHRLSSPVVCGNYVYATSWDQQLYCLDANTGEKLWHWSARTVLGQSPVVTGNAIYIADREALYCLCTQTKKLRWRYVAPQPCSPLFSGSTNSIGDDIYFADANGKLYCLNAETGEQRYSVETNTLNIHSLSLDSRGVIAVSNNAIVCADKKLSCLCWKREGRFDDAIPVLAHDNIYIGTFEEGLWCLDKESGRIRWIFSTEAQIRAAPAVAKGRIFFGDTSGCIGCIDAFTGELLWKPTGNRWTINKIACSTAHVVAWPFVYILLDDGVLYCLNALTGVELWCGEVQVWQPGVGSLAVTAHAIYYVTRNDILGCIGSSNFAAQDRSVSTKTIHPSSRTNIPPSLKDETSVTESSRFIDYGRATSLSKNETQDLHSAVYFLMQNRLDEGIAILRRLQRARPDEGIVLHNLGNAYEWKGLTGDALAIFDHILEINPDDVQAFEALGRLLRTHPDFIQAIYGSSPPIYQPPSVTREQHAQQGLRIANYANESVVLVGVDGPLAAIFGESPAWYWWQLIETSSYPVIRLYLEFDYQPYRYYDQVLPLDVADPQTELWLEQLQVQESIAIHIYDLTQRYCNSKRLDFSSEQCKRLRSLYGRAQRFLATLPIAARNFQAGIVEAQKIWTNAELSVSGNESEREQT